MPNQVVLKRVLAFAIGMSTVLERLAVPSNKLGPVNEAEGDSVCEVVGVTLCDGDCVKVGLIDGEIDKDAL